MQEAEKEHAETRKEQGKNMQRTSKDQAENKLKQAINR